MTRKKPTVKRKPRIQRKVTVCRSAEDLAVALDLPKSVAADWERRIVPPSRWSRVVGWVRENPLDAVLIGGASPSWRALSRCYDPRGASAGRADAGAGLHRLGSVA